MSHHLGVIHFALPAANPAEQVHKSVKDKLDWEIEALAKAKVYGPDYFTFAGLVALERVGDSYGARAYNPTSADSYDDFSGFARWLSLGSVSIPRGGSIPMDAEPLCGAVIDVLMPRPPEGHDTETADALIDSFDVSEWKAERFCRYVMNAVGARNLALDDYPTRAERLMRLETWRPDRAAAELLHPFIYAANGARILGEHHKGLPPAERWSSFSRVGCSILPPSTGGHWLAFVDFHI